MAYDAQRTEIIARTRKEARLSFKSSCTTSRRYYSTDTFTPEQVRQNDTVVWQTIKIYHGGQWREVRFKEVNNVLWRTGTKRRPMRLIVIAPTPYRLTKNKKLYYRNPAYLLTTDLEASVELLTQKYFDRWQIEVNHREEKDTLGVGKAKVRSDKSVPRQPAFVVATYAALLLAGVIGCQDQRQAEFTPLPEWRKFSKRLSCLDLVTQLRREVVDNPKIQSEIGIQATAISTVLQSAA